MYVASLELSKQLYEVSGWAETEFWHYNTGATGWKVDTGHAPLPKGYYDNVEKFVPAYDLGYLLRKLPKQLPDPDTGYESEDYLAIQCFSNSYSAWYVDATGEPVPDFTENADTPEDALAKLAIRLFKQGVLK